MEGQKISRGQGGGVESTMDDAMTLIVSVMFDMKMCLLLFGSNSLKV